MHVAEAGPGIPVILGHGFPHRWSSRPHRLAAIAAAGYTVPAFFLTGERDLDLAEC
jgi:hypothetical protein